MKKINLTLIASAFLLIFGSQNGHSSGRSTAGLTLLEASSARSAALGNAYSAAKDDVSAVSYNPATLDTLTSSEASFLYQKGLSEDSYGHFAIGMPADKHNFGASLAYYNSGVISAFDGTHQRSIVGQRDFNLNLTYATSFRKTSFGFSGKYLSSEIAEKSVGSAMAIDMGIVSPLNNHLSFGLAVQNIGTKMTYERQDDTLPQIGRAGLSWSVVPYKIPTTLFVDVPYFVQQNAIKPGLGLESLFGPLALRAGYKGGSDLQEFTFGMGFMWNRSRLDYSFGFVDQLNSTHRISFSMRFGPIIVIPEMVKAQDIKTVQKAEVRQVQPIRRTVKELPPQQPIEFRPLGGKSPAPHVYIVKEGDTLKSIAKQYYGRSELWNGIFMANRGSLSDPDNLTPGQKILLPKRSQ